MKKIVSVVACNSLKMPAGEISRLAAYRVVEIERPRSTFLLGLPGLDAEKEKNVYAVRHYPQVAIEGCDKRCATRILEFWNVKHIKTLTVPKILNTNKINLKEVSVWPPNRICMKAVKRVSSSAASFVDGFLDDYPVAGTDHRLVNKYICSACGWVYDIQQGDPDFGVAPGVCFDNLPEDWNCPVCAVPADNFEPAHPG